MATTAQNFPIISSDSLNRAQGTGSSYHDISVRNETSDQVYSYPPPLLNGNALLEKVKRSYERQSKPEKNTPKSKRIKLEPLECQAQSHIQDHMPVQKKKRDRFKGTTEEEVLQRVLPDHIKEGLDILIVGINPGLTAAYIQHHYAGPGNHFWKCLYLAGMTPEPMTALQDAELLNYGIGFTNIVARTTRGSADLSRKEIAEGGEILKEKILRYTPRIAVFNGKGIYEVFCGHKNFNFGLQPDPFPGCPNTCVFVNPSSSARCSQLPRATDKVPFYEALKRVRDYIRTNGSVDGIDRSTVTFPDFKLVTAPHKVKIEVKQEPEESNQQSISPLSPNADLKNKHVGNTSIRTSKAKNLPRKDKLTSASNNGKGFSEFEQSRNNHNELNGNFGLVLNSAELAGINQLPSANSAFRNQPITSSDYVIKKEVLDPHQRHSDPSAVIQHNYTNQQDMLMQQQMFNSGIAKAPDMNMPDVRNISAAHSMVKQEQADWFGYGIMPTTACGPNTPMSSAYQRYQCIWNYLPSHSNSGFTANPYYNIPTSQFTHSSQVAVAAAAVQPNLCHSNPNVAGTSYSRSPQEASSPAMSSQSNLTQASLDSLPKADSASTVANWLQNIPYMSMAQ